MSPISQALLGLFPMQSGLLFRLQAEDRRFQHLASRFQQIDNQLRFLEANTESAKESAKDERIEALQRQRMALLEEISAHISKQTPG